MRSTSRAWRRGIETEVEISCDATYFRIAGRFEVYEDGAQLATRRFDERIARDMI
jgi:hypothetical protein